MAYRGDLIGCTVKFDLAAEGKVLVVFTLNGKQLTQDEISIDNPDKKPLYPYIGMAHQGIRVLAKVGRTVAYTDVYIQGQHKHFVLRNFCITKITDFNQIACRVLSARYFQNFEMFSLTD